VVVEVRRVGAVGQRVGREEVKDNRVWGEERMDDREEKMR